MNNLSNGCLRVFTWHIHGSYLFYLSQGDYEIYIPYNQERSTGYVGRGETFPFGNNVIEVHAADVRNLDFDIILFQTDENYLIDQYDILSETQRSLPKIYLEHDPPWSHPTNARHPVKEKDILVVHVTDFNALMWDCNGLKTRVINHGVLPKPNIYNGSLARGIVVINNLPSRGRLLGKDIFETVRKEVPLDLVGMGAEEYGIGEVLHPELPQFVSKYRFFFNPIRYTSLGLAVCEAMMIGSPIVGLATTQMAVQIRNGYSGFVANDVSKLIDFMQLLLEQPELAKEMGQNAHLSAHENFNIHRFVNDWKTVFEEVVQNEKTHQII